MNGLTRYRIEIGPRCTFDGNTFMDTPFNNSTDNDRLIQKLCFDVDETTDEWYTKSPEKLSVSPNQKLNIYGIFINVPSDATKMIKWSSDSIKSALLFFLKSDTELVDNAFAYQICMDNWIEIDVAEEQPIG